MKKKNLLVIKVTKKLAALKLIIFILILLTYPNSVKSQNKFSNKIDNVQNVFDNYFKIKYPVKDEFETTENYLNRIPKVTDNKTYYFEIPAATLFNMDDSTMFMSIFNFKQETIRFMKKESPYNFYDTVLNCRLKVDTYAKKLKSYNASNAYGTKFKVNSYHVKYYYLDSIFINKINIKTKDTVFDLEKDKYWIKYDDDYGNTWNSIDFEIKMRPSVAKKHSKNIYAILCIRFPNYFSRFYDYSEIDPKISSPTEVLSEEYFLKCDLLQILLINKQTKEIIAEITPVY